MAGLTSAVVALACIDITVDSGALGSIEFVRFQLPSIVQGDTLRDSLGMPSPLSAIVYNAAGDVIRDREVQFVSSDTTLRVRITADGQLVALDTATGTARVVAVVDGLQSVTQTIDIVPAPDTFFATAALNSTIAYRPRATSNLDTSSALSVRVRSLRKGVDVGRWVVRYQLQRKGTPLPTNDTLLLALVDDAFKVSNADTTDTGGSASRRLRIRAALGTRVVDTLQVVATAQFKGLNIRGGAITFTVVVRPAT